MAKTSVIDKWKTKKFFEIYAPKEIFNEVYLGETFAADHRAVPGRIIEVPLSSIFGGADAKQPQIKLLFRTEEPKGTHVSTKFLGHTTIQDYERSIARKRISKVYINQVAITKDSHRICVKAVLITLKNINKARQSALGKKFREFVSEESKSANFNEFLKSIFTGKLSIKAKKAVHSVYPVRQVVVQKTEIL